MARKQGERKQGESAGTGKGASLPSLWKAKQALNPFPTEPALPDTRGSLFCVERGSPRAGQFHTEPLPATAAGPRCVTLSLISAERAWKMRQGPGSRLCRQGPRSTGVFLGWQPAPAHQLSQFRSRELFHSSPTSASPCPPCSHPDSFSPVGTEQLWGEGGRNQPVWGAGWGHPCVSGHRSTSGSR